MKYADFLQISAYGNENWKGAYSSKEVQENAQAYYADFLWSKSKGKIANSIKTLCENLAEDLVCMPDLIEPKVWLERIKSELKGCDGW